MAESVTVDHGGVTHRERLLQMAVYLRRLVDLSQRANGFDPEWAADRLAEADALETGAQALQLVLTVLVEEKDRLTHG